jgi:hypothetical protein
MAYSLGKHVAYLYGMLVYKHHGLLLVFGKKEAQIHPDHTHIGRNLHMRNANEEPPK